MRIGKSSSRTTASASRRSITSASSWCSSGCTTRPSIRGRESGSPSARRWPSDTAGASGSSRNPAKAAPSISRYRRKEEACMTDGRSPVEILLVEDNPGDERLTREALREGKVYHNLHWVKDGVEAMAFLKREGKYRDVPRPDIV